MESTPTGDSPPPLQKVAHPKLFLVPPLPFVGLKRTRANSISIFQKTVIPSPGELRLIFEAENPDELALVDAAYSYNCKLLKRTHRSATVLLPGADSTILKQLAPTDDVLMQQLIYCTQQHLNAYARQGLRVLVMAKRILSESEFDEWEKSHTEAELSLENRDKKIRESYAKIETNLVLLGATGIEDRLQEGVPETIAALMSAGIIVWVLTGDKPETAINVAYSAKLFSPQMELLKVSARSKDAAETAIKFYLSEIKREQSPSNPRGASGLGLNQVGTLTHTSSLGESSHSSRSVKKRALVVDGKTLLYILDRRSNLQEPFLELTRYCSSVLCCRATPLQKAYIVKTVKEVLKMRTLAIGDGANDVSMIQTADVGIGISGQEGMQAVMTSDFALSRFKYLEHL